MYYAHIILNFDGTHHQKNIKKTNKILLGKNLENESSERLNTF